MSGRTSPSEIVTLDQARFFSRLNTPDVLVLVAEDHKVDFARTLRLLLR